MYLVISGLLATCPNSFLFFLNKKRQWPVSQLSLFYLFLLFFLNWLDDDDDDSYLDVLAAWFAVQIQQLIFATTKNKAVHGCLSCFSGLTHFWFSFFLPFLKAFQWDRKINLAWASIPLTSCQLNRCLSLNCKIMPCISIILQILVNTYSPPLQH